ncbi:MAG: 3'(2'),5'-bisphosphate nucleotidase CysQ [Stenomitos frigidus ULC029]
MNPISPDLDRSIRQLLRSCGQYAKQMADSQFEVFEKGPDDYVTSIDAALDQKLAAAFTTMFPEDGVITEEDAQSRQRFHASYSRLWCIDPIDGTEDFIHRKRDYAVMVGLLQNQQPIAGWLYAPAYDQLYYGGPDWGLFQAAADAQPETLIATEPAPPTTGFCPVLIGHRDQAQFGSAIAQLIPEAQFYSLGSFGLKVVDVVLGRAGLYLYFNGRVKLWDTVGPLALAKAAGLVCCDLEGRSLGFSPDDVNGETLAHNQPILVGWSDYIERLRPKLKAAVEAVAQNLKPGD